MASPMLEMGSTVAYVRRRKGERVEGRVEARRREVVVRRAAIASVGEVDVYLGKDYDMAASMLKTWSPLLM